MGVVSVPEVFDPLGVAAVGLAATDADHVKTLWAGFERAQHRRSDSQYIPLGKVDDLLVELGTTGTGDDDIGLLLLAVSAPTGIRAPGS